PAPPPARARAAPRRVSRPTSPSPPAPKPLPLSPGEMAGVRGAPRYEPPLPPPPPLSAPPATRPRSRPPPENALRSEGEHERHDHEREHHAVGRRVGESVLLRHPDENRPDRCADHAAHPADDAHQEGGELVARTLAGGDRERGAADHPREAGEAGADCEGDREDELHVDSGGGQHSPLVAASSEPHCH